MVNIKDVKLNEKDKNLIDRIQSWEEIDFDVLKLIYDKQKELMIKYWTIKECWSVNLPEVQASIRRFTKYTVEEISEAFEEVFKYRKVTNDKKVEYDKDDKEKFIKILEWDKLKHLQEEIADSIHFYLEKLILSNIEDVDILYQEIEDIIKEEKWENVQILTYQDLEKIVKKYNSEDFANITLWRVFEYWFRFIYSVNISDNFLRNKEWKKTNVPTYVEWFIKSIAISLYHLVEFLLALQIDSKKLLELYILKHNVNKFRIRSKY